MPKKQEPGLLLLNRVHQTILLLRGQRIILDADLARLYGVPTRVLNQATKRNLDRFPEDFMFRLTAQEFANLMSQSVTSSLGASPTLRNNVSHGGTRKLPYAFTEHGAIMAATVLNSKEAVKASLFVVRAFVQLRELLSTHHDLAAKLEELEKKLQNHDEQILAIIDAIRQLMEVPDAGDSAKPPIGFHTELAAPKANSRSTAKSPKRLPGKTSKSKAK